jgi:hypothetical protein
VSRGPAGVCRTNITACNKLFACIHMYTWFLFILDLSYVSKRSCPGERFKRVVSGQELSVYTVRALALCVSLHHGASLFMQMRMSPIPCHVPYTGHAVAPLHYLILSGGCAPRVKVGVTHGTCVGHPVTSGRRSWAYVRSMKCRV